MFQNSHSYLFLIIILVVIVRSSLNLNQTFLSGSFSPKNESNNYAGKIILIQNQNQRKSSRLQLGHLVPVPPRIDIGGAFEVINTQFVLPVLLPTNSKAKPPGANGGVVETHGFRKIKNFIKSAGYPFQHHRITTTDGYIITIFRIQHGKNEPNERRKLPRQPVYLGHGLMSSAGDWIAQGEGKSLPYILADAGFDVWLANCRGNNYAMQHDTFDSSSSEFWNFSVHEMGKIDVPQIIDYILKKTYFTQLNYIGYSQSTTSYFICMSEHPKYNDKINKMVAIAPAVFLRNTNEIGKLIAIARKAEAEGGLVDLGAVSGGQLVPSKYLDLVKHSGIAPCSLLDLTHQVACQSLLNTLAGHSDVITRQKVSTDAQYFFPAPASEKTLDHYLQWFLKDSFCQYDYGELYNPYFYNGSTTAPEYNLNATKGNILVISGTNDALTTQIDIQTLMKRLPNANLRPLESIIGFNHLNFFTLTQLQETFTVKLFII